MGESGLKLDIKRPHHLDFSAAQASKVGTFGMTTDELLSSCLIFDHLPTGSFRTNGLSRYVFTSLLHTVPSQTGGVSLGFGSKFGEAYVMSSDRASASHIPVLDCSSPTARQTVKNSLRPFVAIVKKCYQLKYVHPIASSQLLRLSEYVFCSQLRFSGLSHSAQRHQLHILPPKTQYANDLRMDPYLFDKGLISSTPAASHIQQRRLTVAFQVWWRRDRSWRCCRICRRP